MLDERSYEWEGGYDRLLAGCPYRHAPPSLLCFVLDLLAVLARLLLQEIE